MDTQIIKLTRDLGKLIQEEPAYKNMMLAHANNDDDAVLQELIGKFNLKKVELNQAMTDENPNQEKLVSLDKELKEIYSEIMENENMKAFSEAKGEMDVLIHKINTIISGSINGENPDAIDVESACTGSCSTCGGCH